MPFSVCAGAVAVAIGLVTFILHWGLWDFWGGPMPGYQILLFPGNLTLSYIWHPMFTEELPLVPKVGLMLVGQFFVVTGCVAVICSVVKRFAQGR